MAVLIIAAFTQIAALWVPAIVSEETFALAAERLADNKRFAPRRTIEPSIVQGGRGRYRV
jgi:hypothetical protein